MEQIQFIQVTPQELANLVAEAVKSEIQKVLIKSIEPQKEAKEFLTRKETAELFGVTLMGLNDWQKNGILKRYKMGRRSYFKYSELLEVLYNSNKQ
jgi:hypothetical protein